jgi:phenylacetate-CoA ligase
VDASGQAFTDRSGDVCVTDLHNYAMPLVRYLNGDSATYSERFCACGRALPLLESIDGRKLDIIVSPDGRTVAGEFFVFVMLDFPQIRQFQIVQDAPDKLEIRIVARADLNDEHRNRLIHAVAHRMGDQVEVWINDVTDIPLTSAGKRRITVSNLARLQQSGARS